MKGLEMGFLEGWTGWEEIDTLSIQFYKPVYKHGVGIPDDIIEQAGEDSTFYLDGENSQISICTDSGEIFSAKIKLVIA